jgi:hypothetical protein
MDEQRDPDEVAVRGAGELDVEEGIPVERNLSGFHFIRSSEGSTTS